MKNEHEIVRKILISMALVAFLFPWGRFATTALAGDELGEKEDAMELAYKNEAKMSEIPPIDAAAPARYETASFGLG